MLRVNVMAGAGGEGGGRWWLDGFFGGVCVFFLTSLIEKKVIFMLSFYIVTMIKCHFIKELIEDRVPRGG